MVLLICAVREKKINTTAALLISHHVTGVGSFNDRLKEVKGNVNLERECKIEEQRKCKLGWREMKNGNLWMDQHNRER